MQGQEVIISTERLILRNWDDSDLKDLHTLCSDPHVMRYFPEVSTMEQSRSLLSRLKNMCDERGYCYFAVELRSSKEFIGFVGLAYQDFEADFTPCVDIGWRLHKKHWSKGFAREAAEASLKYAFEKLELDEVLCLAPKVNSPSIALMERIGMTYVKDFIHSRIPEGSDLNPCVLYRIKRK